jgi:hypothetical protein
LHDVQPDLRPIVTGYPDPRSTDTCRAD